LGVGRRADDSALENFTVAKNSVMEAELPLWKRKERAEWKRITEKAKTYSWL
jgi:hypothetical protein